MRQFVTSKMKFSCISFCTDNFLLKPDDGHVTHCVVDGKQYAELSLVPSMNTSDPCEVCHCCVSACVDNNVHHINTWLIDF